jgi:hypothetical protein
MAIMAQGQMSLDYQNSILPLANDCRNRGEKTADQAAWAICC